VLVVTFGTSRDGREGMETLDTILKHKGSEVYSTSPKTPILQVAREMCRRRVGALLVIDGDRPVGIISERDIMNKVVCERRDPAIILAEEIMTQKVICADIGATPEQAMSIMTEHRIRHLPVLIEGRVIGIVSIGDVVRWASDEQTHEIQMLNDYVMGRYPG
jgi:CBS domain-containing protein